MYRYLYIYINIYIIIYTKRKRLVCTRTLIPDGVSTRIARKTTIGNIIAYETIYYFYIFTNVIWV